MSVIYREHSGYWSACVLHEACYTLSPVLFLPDLVLSPKHSVFPQHGGNVLPLTVARRGHRWYYSSAFVINCGAWFMYV